MANVIFKRGNQANLPAANAAQDGVFYLTEDTGRLYVGQGTKLVELNKSITVVNSVNQLPQSGVQVGQFYYIAGTNIHEDTSAGGNNGNILAVVFDTEMFKEFFYSVSYAAEMNLHFKQLSGTNNHHIIEAAFKAFANALDIATGYDPRLDGGLLSTKGAL